jgi:hypothetical protein
MKIIDFGVTALSDNELSLITGGCPGVNLCGANVCGIDSCIFNVCGANACGINVVGACAVDAAPWVADNAGIALEYDKRILLVPNAIQIN